MPVHCVKKIKCDFLSASGRKYLRAPRGTGFLYVNENILDQLEPLMLDLHGAEWVEDNKYVQRKDARKFELWESNLVGKIGLKEAAKYANGIGIEKIWIRVQELADIFRKKLSSMNGITTHDQGIIKSGIVTFSPGNLEPVSVKNKLMKKNINVSVTQKSSTHMNLQMRNIDYMIRASVHYYNTEEEIDKFVHELSKLIQ